MDDLLAHRQWVRALARRLAADESSADDLEQETWLAAVEHPPRDARSPRGWLGTVLRNVHRNAARGASRRGRREEAVARRATSETADDLVAEAEMQTVLVREVLALDEPYRSTVLLRWFEDLTPDEVARRQGVPLETVRTRLKRAVARLRERMDERHGGDRRAWCLLLLGRDATGTGTGAGTTAATIAAGGMAMGLAAKLTVAAVVLVALGATAWWMRGDDVAAPPAQSDETAATAPAAPPPKHERHGAKPDDAVATTAVVDLTKVDCDLDLHGVVVRADGSPVAGARVQAVDYPWRRTMVMDVAALFDERLGASTTTSAEGAFALRLRRGETRLLRVSAEGLATREVGPFQAGERVKVTMTPGVTLRVSLTDEAKAPVAGATLWLLGFGSRGDQPWINVRATTDAAGRCAFGGLPGGATVGILPLANVGDYGMQQTTLAASGESNLDIVVPAGRTIRGRVFDAVTLAPIAEARVGLGNGWLFGTTTDGGGRFELRNFTGKSERDVHAKATGYAQAGLRIETQDEVEIALPRGVGLTGRVVGPDGAPLVGAFVAVQGMRNEGAFHQYCCATTVTDAEGRFRAADLDRAAPLWLSAQMEGFGGVRRAVPVRPGTDSVDLGDVLLPASRAIEGRVLSADGAPLPGIDVRLAGPGVGAPPQMQDPAAREERRTDDLGRFRFGDLSAGAFAVEAQVQRGTPLSAKVTLTADADVTDVVLQPKSAGGTAVVVVVKDEAGAPLADVDVLGRDDADGRAQVKSDASGRAVLIPPGERPISKIDVGGYTGPYVRVPTILVEPGRREYVVTLEKAVQTTVRVLDPDGAPLRRASIAVEPADRTVVYSTPQADGAWTDAEGRMCLSLPQTGEFSVVCHGVMYDEKRRKVDSLLEARLDHVVAGPDEVTLRCRRIDTGRTAIVRVIAVDGSPKAGIEVQLTAYAAITRKVKTDAAGLASFDGLPAHPFVAHVPQQREVLVPESDEFVPSGQEIVLQFETGASVTGTVVWSGGEPAKAVISVTRRGSGVFTTSSGADGRFTVQVPLEGTGPFGITANAPNGAVWVSSDVPVSASDRDVRIELKR
jgi:RNA polymerase sigma-70 factor (ECF subfamily)